MNTDEFEGHTPGPWRFGYTGDTYAVITGKDDWILRVDVENEGVSLSEADAKLIATAPNLLAEVKRLRKTIEDIEATAQDYDHSEVEEIISICMSVMERDSVGYNSDIPWKNVHSGDD